MPAQLLGCALAKQIGIALAGLGKFDESLGDDSICKIVRKR